MNASILLVEDEEKLARFVELELMHEGYRVQKSGNGREALEMALKNDYDLILLDIMLPGLNGLEVLRRLLKEKEVPVILLTARDAVMDMIEVMPTASGDPLLKMSKLDDNLDDSQMFISQSVADKFKVRAGDELRLLISRKKNEVMEAKSLYLKVKGVLPRNLLPKNALMVNLKLLFAIEDYRDGYEPLLISDGSSAKEVHRFYSARIYVSDLDDVEPMTRLITSRFGLEISSAITSIKQFKDITDVLNVIFLVLTVISCIGGILAFGGIIYNNLFRARASCGTALFRSVLS